MFVSLNLWREKLKSIGFGRENKFALKFFSAKNPEYLPIFLNHGLYHGWLYFAAFALINLTTLPKIRIGCKPLVGKDDDLSPPSRMLYFLGVYQIKKIGHPDLGIYVFLISDSSPDTYWGSHILLLLISIL